MKAGIAMRILLIADFTHAAAVHTALCRVDAAAPARFMVTAHCIMLEQCGAGLTRE